MNTMLVKELARFLFNAGLNGSIPENAEVRIRNTEAKTECAVIDGNFDGEMTLRLYVDSVDVVPDLDMIPAGWWRVRAPDGSLWCETSDETEARQAMRPGDKLFRLYSQTFEQWREVMGR